MSISRNAPCPCGSGRKYKHCCQRVERRLASTRPTDVPRSPHPASLGQMAPLTEEYRSELALGGAALSIEILVHPVGMPESIHARPMLVVGIVDELRCVTALFERLPTDADAVAEAVAGWLRRVFAAFGQPWTLELCRGDLAEAFGRAFAAERIYVVERPRPRGNVEVIHAIRREHDLPMSVNLPFVATTWAAWEFPAPIIGGLFEAAADYHRAAPWTLIDDRLGLALRTESGGEWWPIILGGGDSVFGLCLFESPADAALFAGHDRSLGDPNDHLRAGFVQLDYSAPSDLPRAMRDEVPSARWTLAGPEAWPVVSANGTLGGTVTPVQCVDLSDALASLARLVKSRSPELLRCERLGLPFTWTDEANGLSLQITPRTLGADRLWRVEEELAPCLAAGAAADPAAALRDLPDADLLPPAVALIDRFHAWLEQRPRQRSKADVHAVRAYRFMGDFLGVVQRIPYQSVTEYDLRSFLVHHLPQEIDQPRANALDSLVSLRLSFQYLREEEGIDAPWAAAALAERDALDMRLETCPRNAWFGDSSALWRLIGDNDLRRRLLLHDGRLAGKVKFGFNEEQDWVGMSPLEASLSRELQRHWLLWRDELLADGVTEPFALTQALKARREAWATAGNGLFRKSPLAQVEAERRRGRGGRQSR